jgi:RND family efflux transporter MFP subunit
VSREELDLSVDTAKSAVARLEREVERLRPLHEKGIVPRQQFDEAKYRLEEAKAEQRRARTAASDKRIVAPTDGVVALRYVTVGQQVATGTPLFRLVQPDDLIVTVNLPEGALSRVFEGQEAYFVSDALADGDFRGTVEKVSPVVDPRTGTVQVTLDVDESDEKARLRPGMFVKTNIVTKKRDGVLTIPRRAAIRGDEGHWVFVVQDGIAHRRPVELGVSEGTRVEVTSGLAEGEAVVVLGQDGLKDGTAVDPQPKFRGDDSEAGDGS